MCHTDFVHYFKHSLCLLNEQVTRAARKDFNCLDQCLFYFANYRHGCVGVFGSCCGRFCRVFIIQFYTLYLVGAI